MDMPANTMIHAGNFDTYKNPPYISIVGQNRNRDIGITYDVPTGKLVYVKKLTIENTFLPLVKKGEGQLTIEELEIRDFGGDAINIRGSNVRINHLRIRNSTPTRPYNPLWIPEYSEKAILKVLQDSKEKVYDWRLLEWLPVTKDNVTTYYTAGYHVDAGLQAYSVQRETPTRPMGAAPKPLYAAQAKPTVLSYRSAPLPALNVANISEIANALYVGVVPSSVPVKAAPQVKRPLGSAKPVQKQADPAVLRLLQALARADVPYETVLTKTGSKQIKQIVLLVSFNPVTPVSLVKPARPMGSSTQASQRPVVGAATTPAVINNIRIEKADINTDSLIKDPVTQQIKALPNPLAQVFMLSEANRYTNIHIGNKGLDIKTSYRYWFSANTLDNSSIGSYSVTPNIQLFNATSQKGCTRVPCVRIGDGKLGSPHLIKPSDYTTVGVNLIHLNKVHEVPPTVSYR